ncbi:twin-arginine translocase subunit TatC [Candidatus Deianiraea vastatrix]|uniref:Sec-independent protein translocase protein TatC n=1 Tax=Candidatus Deianiraea vastatrix TaxID=2163644 RepID=A0A5B8XEE6_9RICK|nr:twin-arginine translocase subunit TatC [Candidatus Deianiraea vastatrix]QED23688.1 Sec-independent protein translocase protein TatC [Candidatus Deianiraea vastatrix]
MKYSDFLEHFIALKRVILRILCFFLVCFGIAYCNYESLLCILTKPFSDKVSDISMIYTGLTEGFLLRIGICFSCSIFASIPFGLQQIYGFCAIGLKKRERVMAKYAIISSVMLFFIGALVAYYFIIPSAIDFFIKHSSTSIIAATLEPKIVDYIDLTLSIMLGFGIAFQAPLIIFFLHASGLVDVDVMCRYRRHIIVIAFIIGAIFTPPDVMSQIILACIMIGLIEASFIVCRAFRSARG